MTLVMYDSIAPGNLPADGDAYLGYVDGKWPTIKGFTDDNGVTWPPLAELFPGKKIISLTVTGATLDADGCDIETGDLGATSGAQWLKNKLVRDPGLPVAYCSISLMPQVIAELAALGVSRDQVRLLSSHYQEGEHICGPDSCAYQQAATPACDATQWTDTGPGVNNSAIDVSLVGDDFFKKEIHVLDSGQYSSGAMIVVLSATNNQVFVTEQAVKGGAFSGMGAAIPGSLPFTGPVQVALEIVADEPSIFVQSADPPSSGNGDVFTSWKNTDGTWATWTKIT